MFKFIASVLIITALSASFSWTADFRENRWGDSPDDVIAVEGEGTIGELRPPGWGTRNYVDCINYSRYHLGVNALIGFIFTPKERLAIGLCFADPPEVSSFYYWQEELSRLYGEPQNRDDILTDDEALLDRYYRGDAGAVEEGLLKGYFALVRFWDTEKTHIWLAAEKGRDELMFYIKYHSKEYFDLYTKEKGKPWPRRGLPPWLDNGNK